MTRKIGLLALLALMTAVLAACGSLNRVTPAELDDAALEADVRGKIAEDDTNDAFQIGVSVDNGVVTLSGTVNSSSARDRIGRAANSVEGVRRVINNLRVVP